MSCKKLKHITTKHNKERQAPCVSRMAQYKPEELGFLYETFKDKQAIWRNYGREREVYREAGVHQKKEDLHWGSSHTWQNRCGNSSGRVNDKGRIPIVLSLLWWAFTTCRSYVYIWFICCRCQNAQHILDQSVFLWWTMQNTSLPNNLVFLFDSCVNLSINHLCSEVRIEYLLPYSLDLNLIKEAFSALPQWLL